MTERKDPPVVIHDGMMWALVTVRKQALCVLSRRMIYPGDKAYRTISNSNKRMQRIRPEAMNFRVGATS